MPKSGQAGSEKMIAKTKIGPGPWDGIAIVIGEDGERYPVSCQVSTENKIGDYAVTIFRTAQVFYGRRMSRVDSVYRIF